MAINKLGEKIFNINRMILQKEKEAKIGSKIQKEFEESLKFLRKVPIK